MNDFERGFVEELEKIAMSAEDLGRLLGQPFRSAGDLGAQLGAGSAGVGRALGGLGRDVGEGLVSAGRATGEAIGEGATAFGEQSGLTHALRTIPTPDIQAGHLLGAGLGATAGGLGGYYAGKKATGTTAGGLAGAGLGAVGGGALGAGAGHLIGGHLRGGEMAEQAAKQRGMEGLISGGRGLIGARAAEANRDIGAMEGAGASGRAAQELQRLMASAEQTSGEAREHALRSQAWDDYIRRLQMAPGGAESLAPWQLEYPSA